MYVTDVNFGIFLSLSLSKVVFDDKFNIKLTVTNRDCSNNLQETLQQLQSNVSMKILRRFTTTDRGFEEISSELVVPTGHLWNKFIVDKIT